MTNSIATAPAPVGQQGMRRQRFVFRSIEQGWKIVAALGGGLIGMTSMVLGLSILATIPIVQFASLGYLLDLGGRVARSGRMRDAFRDVWAWSTIGGAALVMWLLLIPLRILADVRDSALLLGNVHGAEGLQIALFIATGLTIVYVAWACYRGARWRHFAWPGPVKFVLELRRGCMWSQSRDRLLSRLNRLDIGGHFWLGLRAAIVGLGWLFLPISLMVVGSRLSEGPAFLMSLFGGLMLTVVLTYLPFLQINFAVDRRLRSGFDYRRVHRQFCRAPIAFWFALLLTLTLAIPLYILKAELIPRESAWLPSVVFVMSVLPARIVTGWAVHRSERRASVRHIASRWTSRLLALPVLTVYAVIVYLTQYISWYGAYSLYEQHAFLLPVPFSG